MLRHEANRSVLTGLLVVRSKADLNSASGIFSDATTLTLDDHAQERANRSGKCGLLPVWTKGTSGVAVQIQLRRVPDEYIQAIRLSDREVGQAPGRL
jgi:hypothetical protein